MGRVADNVQAANECHDATRPPAELFVGSRLRLLMLPAASIGLGRGLGEGRAGRVGGGRRLREGGEYHCGCELSEGQRLHAVVHQILQACAALRCARCPVRGATASDSVSLLFQT